MSTKPECVSVWAEAAATIDRIIAKVQRAAEVILILRLILANLLQEGASAGGERSERFAKNFSRIFQ